MLYAILCYDSEDVVGAWTKEEDDAVMARLGVVQQKLAKQGRLGPVARLLPTTAATTRPEGPRAAGHRRPVRRDQGAAARLLRRRVRDARGGDRDRARIWRAPAARTGAYELRPLALFRPGDVADVTDLAWIDAALTAARPQAIGALLRYFRDLDTAEEAFQDACLRRAQELAAERPAARSRRLAHLRRAQRRHRRGAAAQQAGAAARRDEPISDLDDAEDALAERLDGAHYRDDILRLLFICCHPDLPATQQIALALRIVSGLSVKQIARAFLVSESAMEQRITRAKSRIAGGRRAVRDAGRGRAGRAARRRRRDDLPRLQRGLFGQRRRGGARAPLCEEAIRLARLLLRLFQSEPEIMGLTALHAAAACARARAVRRRRRHRAARGSGSRPLGPAR